MAFCTSEDGQREKQEVERGAERKGWLSMYFRQINCKRSQAEIAGYMDRTWVPYAKSSSWP